MVFTTRQRRVQRHATLIINQAAAGLTLGRGRIVLRRRDLSLTDRVGKVFNLDLA